MKNNRQVGLDGKIFVSACMHRGSFFAFILMLYGLLTAGADILKLTGASGVAMGSFTTTLLIYDFIVSLMLVAVVFYAYFLECGADVPVLKEKPLVVFGFFRLGYYLLLSYYICYHMLFCFANKDAVPRSLGIYYLLYLLLICLLVLANCYIFNTITRNIIRRSYSKSFRRLAVVGLIVQVLLPVAYLFVRIFMKDIGDEFLTSAVCDLIRLCVCPLLLSSLWFLFLHAKEQVNDVYREVDSAIVSKRYQITYSAYTSGKNGKNGEPVKASATILPAPAETPAISQSKKEKHAALPSAVSKTADAVSAAVIASNVQEAAAEKSAACVPAETVTEENKPEVPAPSDNLSDEKISEFAAEARRAVAKSSQMQNSQQPKSRPQTTPQHQTEPSQQPAAPAASVQEFDPFPASSVPRNVQKQGAATPSAHASQNRGTNVQRPQQNHLPQNHLPQNRPQQGQRPVQNQQSRPQQGQRSAYNQQNRPQQGQRTVQNSPNRQRSYNGQNGGSKGGPKGGSLGSSHR